MQQLTLEFLIDVTRTLKGVWVTSPFPFSAKRIQMLTMPAILAAIQIEQLVEFALLSSLLIVGFYVVYMDINFHRIPNKAILALFALGIIGHIVWWALGQTSPFYLIGTFLIGGCFGYVLAVAGFWAPGDAKLNWALLVIIPPSLLIQTMGKPTVFSWRDLIFPLDAPLWSLLTNQIVVHFAILVVVMLAQRRMKIKAQSVEFDLKNLVCSLFVLTSLAGAVTGYVAFALENPLTVGEVATVAFVLFLLFDRFVPANYHLAISGPGLMVGLYVVYQSSDWKAYLALNAILWCVYLFYHLVYHRYKNAFVQHLPLQMLQPGMTLRQPLVLSRSRYNEGELLSRKMLSEMRHAKDRGMDIGNAVEVEGTLPFAPAIVGSVILTLVAKGNSVILLSEYLGEIFESL